ncbi:hypothetical protein RHMOL_Rhmol08G0226400 [Rhododendron molle]|uniref:Uncharacterized protein n=1 Tax=Rhododendron molle TaxID=49168 RepID=A0ACC0MT92_RHOML|nr:hypothetical protein RHMOL_Rhmol08G0226400 [Rhododendron molle]
MKDQNEYLNVKADDFEDAVTFLTKVKGAYSHDEGRYKSFVDIINRVNIDKNFVEAYTEVCNLFHDRRDLIVGFTKFLPVADKNDA